MYEENSLTHWGIKGMKWGVRRYQNKDGSLTPAGKKRYGEEETSDESPEEYEAAKQKALKSGSAREVLKFQGDLTNAELRAAKDRLDLERQLNDLDQSAIDAGRKKVTNVIDNVRTGVNAINTVTDAWNAVAKINNTFNSNKMKTIGGGGEKVSAKGIWDSLKKSKTQDEVLKKMGSYSDEEIAAIKKRMNFEEDIKSTLFNTGGSSKSKNSKDPRVDDIIERLEELENNK